jgi:hypothetical protein
MNVFAEPRDLKKYPEFSRMLANLARACTTVVACRSPDNRLTGSFDLSTVLEVEVVLSFLCVPTAALVGSPDQTTQGRKNGILGFQDLIRFQDRTCPRDKTISE